MNKKGQTVMVGIMISVMLLITAVVFIEPIKQVVGVARSASYLDCDNTSISTGNSMTCIVVDWYMPIFLGMIVMIALTFIGVKSLRQGGDL